MFVHVVFGLAHFDGPFPKSRCQFLALILGQDPWHDPCHMYLLRYLIDPSLHQFQRQRTHHDTLHILRLLLDTLGDLLKGECALCRRSFKHHVDQGQQCDLFLHDMGTMDQGRLCFHLGLMFFRQMTKGSNIARGQRIQQVHPPTLRWILSQDLQQGCRHDLSKSKYTIARQGCERQIHCQCLRILHIFQGGVIEIPQGFLIKGFGRSHGLAILHTAFVMSGVYQSRGRIHGQFSETACILFQRLLHGTQQGGQISIAGMVLFHNRQCQ
mmetsp:Transcript_20411/g.47224  ORF Transcript_20411/g.47224 Transcript_20411/m.47224 type:complete len:269 (-) Transcript_20411:395-1201(-)